MPPGVPDTAMEDAPPAALRTVDHHANGTFPLMPRAIDQGYTPYNLYAPAFPHPPMAPMAYPANGPMGLFNGNSGPGAQPASQSYTRIESISDLVLPDPLDFEFSPKLGAVLHTGKCAECVRFAMHISTPANHDKFLSVSTAHGNLSTGPLRTENERLRGEALTASAEIEDLKDALRANRQVNTTLKSQWDNIHDQNNRLIADYRAVKQRVKELERQQGLASPRVSGPSNRSAVQRSPPHAGPRISTPYGCPQTGQASRTNGRRSQPQVPVVLEPGADGDVILASFPATIHPFRMHCEQPRYGNRRPCPVANF